MSRTQNLCPQQMLRARANGETFVSATMCPQQCVLVCQYLSSTCTLFLTAMDYCVILHSRLLLKMCFCRQHNLTVLLAFTVLRSFLQLDDTGSTGMTNKWSSPLSSACESSLKQQSTISSSIASSRKSIACAG